MPNVFKYSPGATGPGTLKKGDFLIGNNTADYGGLSFWNGISPASGGYTIYLNKASQGPSIYTPANDAELLDLTNNQIAGGTWAPAGYTGAAQCLDYFAGQSDKVCVNRDYEEIVANSLVLNADAGFTPSYPRIGTTWYNTAPFPGVTGTLVNGPSYSSAGGGSIVFDGADDYVDLTPSVSSLRSLQSGTIEQWLNLGSSQTSCTSFFIGVDINNRFEFVFGDRGSVANESTGIIVVQGGVNTFVCFVVQSSSSFYFDNQWHQFVYASDSTGNSFYVDGVKQSPTYTFGNASTQQFFSLSTPATIANIGRRVLSGVPSQIMKGSNSVTRIYNYRLSDSEVLQNFNAQKSRFGL